MVVTVNFNEIIGVFKENNHSMIVLENGNKFLINRLPNQVLAYLQKELHSFQFPFKTYKLPIYLHHLFLQPTSSLKNKECEFINCFKIIKIKKVETGSLIYFENYIHHLPLPPKIIYKYINQNILYKIRIKWLLL